MATRTYRHGTHDEFGTAIGPETRFTIREHDAEGRYQWRMHAETAIPGAIYEDATLAPEVHESGAVVITVTMHVAEGGDTAPLSRHFDNQDIIGAVRFAAQELMRVPEVPIDLPAVMRDWIRGRQVTASR